MSSFETMQKHYQEYDLAVKEWKDKGGKVVGYWCTNTPEEIIYAGGMLPVRLVGDPSMEITVGNLYMEDSYCSFVRVLFDQILRGKFNQLDAIVIPRSCDAIIRAAKYLWTVKDMEDIQFPDMYWLEMPGSGDLISYEFYLDRVNNFKKEMEELSGNTISDDSLFKAIEVYNKNRTLLQKIVALRTSEPPRISGTEALQIIGSGFFMPKEEHNRLLEQLLEEIDTFPPKKTIRLFLSGSCMDKIETVEFIESCGANIVGDDICTGDRYTEGLVEPLPNPVEALANRYLHKAPCPRMIPMERRLEDFRQKVKDSKPQGVIFYLLRWCDTNMWDYVALKDILQELGIPHYYLDMQEYRVTNPESLRTRVEALIESIGGV